MNGVRGVRPRGEGRTPRFGATGKERTGVPAPSGPRHLSGTCPDHELAVMLPYGTCDGGRAARRRQSQKASTQRRARSGEPSAPTMSSRTVRNASPKRLAWRRCGRIASGCGGVPVARWDKRWRNKARAGRSRASLQRPSRRMQRSSADSIMDCRLWRRARSLDVRRRLDGISGGMAVPIARLPAPAGRALRQAVGREGSRERLRYRASVPVRPSAGRRAPRRAGASSGCSHGRESGGRRRKGPCPRYRRKIGAGKPNRRAGVQRSRMSAMICRASASPTTSAYLA